MEAVLDDPFILIANQKISNVPDLLPVLNATVQAGRPLLIISDDLEGEALAALIVNKARGTFSVAAVRAPSFGDRRKRMMEDLAILTGGEVVTAELGMTSKTPSRRSGPPWRKVSFRAAASFSSAPRRQSAKC